jgi:hypothetical protein
MSGGEQETRPDFYTPAEMREMFSSSEQQRKILDYCNTHMIPDRLFSGDDVGNANAQQRILISAHILSHGTVRAGSFTQRLHARFCGHWVELVNNYAGQAPTEGRGIENAFDHAGGVVLGGGRLCGEYEGTRTEVDESERGEGHTRRRFRRAPLPINDFDTIRPGDWLYVFTGTDTPGGDHSVIFSNWLSEVQEAAGIHYRIAAVFSQTQVERGGSRDVWRLGDQAGWESRNPIYPITRVVRYDPSSHPPATVAEVEAYDLGVRARSSSLIARRNDQYIRRHTPRGQHIDRNALSRFLQDANSSLLDQFGRTGAAEPGQLMLWRAANQSSDLEVLIRLNERVNNLIRGASTLVRAEEAEASRVDPRREAAVAEADAERLHLASELERLDTDIQRLGDALAIDEAASPLREQYRILYRDRRRVVGLLSRARGGGRTALLDRRREIDAQREELMVRILEIEARQAAAIQAALAAEGHWRVGGRIGREHYNRLLVRRSHIQQEILSLDEAGGYRLSHPGRDFRSHETMARLTGLLENVIPQPAWSAIVSP